MRFRSGPAGLLAGLCAAALLGGCGTTVDPRSVTSGLAETTAATGPGSGANNGPGADTGSSSTPSSGSVATGAAPPVAPGAGNATGSNGPGPVPPVTSLNKSVVYIGYGSDDVAGYLKTFGINVGSTGDIRAQMAAIAADINRRGGLAGRRISLVQHKFDTAQTLNDPNTAAQAACADWTQDHKVFAVVMPDVVNDTLLRCLHKANTPVVNAGGFANLQLERFYQPTYSAYPTFFNVGTMLGETFDRIAIRRLVERRFFQTWDTVAGAPGSAPMKLGVLVPDSAGGETALRSITAQLARHGIKPTDVVRHSTNVANRAAESSNAVLRFRTDGITHVIGDMGVVFMQNAENQHYRPRYLIPFFPAIFAANAPSGQLQGAMAEEGLPAVATDAAHDPGDPSPASKYCKKVMAAAGLPYTDRTTLHTMLSQCDSLYSLKAAIDQGGVLSKQGLVKGFESLGSRNSAVTWGSFFSPTQHASATVLRDMSFQAACKCFFFTSNKNHG